MLKEQAMHPETPFFTAQDSSARIWGILLQLGRMICIRSVIQQIPTPALYPDSLTLAIMAALLFSKGSLKYVDRYVADVANWVNVCFCVFGKNESIVLAKHRQPPAGMPPVAWENNSVEASVFEDTKEIMKTIVVNGAVMATVVRPFCL